MDINISDSDCEEMPDLEINTPAVQPYQFEPRKGTESNSTSESEETDSEEDELSEDGDGSVEEGVDDVSIWCTCNHCMKMSTKRDSKCCQDTNIVDGKMEEAGIECITLHEGFQANCLNQYVLETSYYEYLQDNGPLEEHQEIHKVYRYIAYRRFVRWIYHWLGKKNRRVLPSCVLKAIRDMFPSQQYCGFKYPSSN